MSISDQTRNVLWTRPRSCAFPGYGQTLTVNEVHARTGDQHVTVVGEQGHIRSPKPGGPRHDPEFDKEKLNEYENLNLLAAVAANSRLQES